jgi:hypothetical protein
LRRAVSAIILLVTSKQNAWLARVARRKHISTRKYDSLAIQENAQ